ncbi:PQ loop repeat protein [Periconia macrospinosa]|uniref:PQ loop repeat protein n=1 Tax=Periconia macrospinosa TaxID=97972 RepID=A0A2V1DBD2_9PLEO|nr:PQ loop repeat protein [Periconia macrospinosa]
MDVPAAANVLGTIGAVCWSVQLLPQIWINWRRHNAVGLQPTMMMLWAWAGVPLGVYNIVENFNIALRIQPQILTLLSLVTWIQCFYYEKNWTVARSLAVVVPVACSMGGIQTGLIFGLRAAKDRELQWPLTLMAVLSAVLLAAGVLRHYWDIYVHRTVRGISFLFVGIDAAGDLFSLISILFQYKLDVLGMVIYGTELVLWIGVFACGGYYNLLPWVRKRLQRRKGGVSDGGNTATPCSSLGGERALQEAAEPIMLHNLPSSTSVFRTPSGEADIIRQRNTGMRGEDRNSSGGA